MNKHSKPTKINCMYGFTIDNPSCHGEFIPAPPPKWYELAWWAFQEIATYALVIFAFEMFIFSLSLIR